MYLVGKQTKIWEERRKRTDKSTFTLKCYSNYSFFIYRDSVPFPDFAIANRKKNIGRTATYAWLSQLPSAIRTPFWESVPVVYYCLTHVHSLDEPLPERSQVVIIILTLHHVLSWFIQQEAYSWCWLRPTWCWFCRWRVCARQFKRGAPRLISL